MMIKMSRNFVKKARLIHNVSRYSIKPENQFLVDYVVPSITIDGRDYNDFMLRKSLSNMNDKSQETEIHLLKTKVDIDQLLDGFEQIKQQKVIPLKLISAMRIVEGKLSGLSVSKKYSGSGKNAAKSYAYAHRFLVNCIERCKSNACFIDVCIENRDFGRVQPIINRIRAENTNLSCIRNKTVILDSIFYEPIIKLKCGLRGSTNLHEIVLLYDEMSEHGLVPNPAIITHILGALGRAESIDSFVPLICTLLDHLEEQNVTLENAILQSTIHKSLIQPILRAVRTVRGDFCEPVPPSATQGHRELAESPLCVSHERLGQLFVEQAELERHARAFEHVARQRGVRASNLTRLRYWTRSWRSQIRRGLGEEQDIDLAPFLQALPVSQLEDVILNGLFALCLNGYEFLAAGVIKRHLGAQIYQKYQHNALSKRGYFENLAHIFSRYHELLAQQPDGASHYQTNFSELWRQSQWENLSAGHGNITHTNSFVPWGEELLSKLGSVMYDIMCQLTIQNEERTEERHVLVGSFREDGSALIISPKVDKDVSQMIKAHSKSYMFITGDLLPMVHPPVPLTTFTALTTPYFSINGESTRIIRKVSHVQLDDDIDRQSGTIDDDLFNSINCLNQCAWEIDGKNLELIKNLFIKGGDSALKIPRNIDEIERSLEDIEKDPVKRKYNSFLVDKSKKEMYSLWMTLMYRLDIAEKFKGQQLWFPCSMDFRSRVYPCSPNLNHIGDDVGRSMLKFARTKPLGEKGLDWIKIHLINLYGSHKRQSNVERLEAANQSLEEIIDSAKQPFKGRGWWMNSEEPWQTLAVCREIVDALEFAENHGQNGCTDNFLSKLSVHQDGSCNGLQHYAALARDHKGAVAVNMTDTERPQDVYSDVLAYVLDKIEEDRNEGIEEAILLHQANVNRKIIKQTVMTTVYGVTRYGATNQIKKQLKSHKSVPDDHIGTCSAYLSRITLDCIGQLFSSATKIKDWLIQCSKNISIQQKSCIQWKTPTGLIVTQPYYKKSKGVLPNPLKNANAFPPNFIHSLDSTHMMMTALRCWEQDVTFVSVHDCFWTHACDVDRMNKICREEFIKLHSQPILQNLSSHLIETFSFDESDNNITDQQKNFNKLLRSIPEQGTFNLEDVQNSTYFFS